MHSAFCFKKMFCFCRRISAAKKAAKSIDSTAFFSRRLIFQMLTEHILNIDSVSFSRILHQHMSYSPDQTAVLHDWTPTHPLNDPAGLLHQYRIRDLYRKSYILRSYHRNPLNSRVIPFRFHSLQCTQNLHVPIRYLIPKCHRYGCRIAFPGISAKKAAFCILLYVSECISAQACYNLTWFSDIAFFHTANHRPTDCPFSTGRSSFRSTSIIP